MTRISRVKGTKMLAPMLLTFLTSSLNVPALAQADTQYFAATSHEVQGKFFSYWHNHGGLMQFGYPISDELTEVSALNGQTYTVQYFERAEFEHHPENQPPYDVELAQLGIFWYHQKYPTGAPNQQASLDQPLQFYQTGTQLGGIFRQYWQSGGGLRQFGFPVSDEFREVSQVNGVSYLVQYFERAEFEYHPENQPPYQVLLTPLGSFYYQQEHSSVVPPDRGSNGPKLLDRAIIGDPVAAGDTVFWQNLDDYSIYSYNFDTEKAVEIIPGGRLKYNLTTDGQTIAWAESTTATYPPDTIVGYDLGSSKQYTILTATYGYNGLSLALDDNVLYYVIDFAGVYSYDLATKQAQLIAPYGRDVVAADGVLLWTELLGNAMNPEYSLHLMKRGSDQNTVIIQELGESFAGYSVSHNYVAWSLDTRDTRHQGIHIYNISDGQDKVIDNRLDLNPVISGDEVVWTDQASGGSISAYNMASGKISTVVEANGVPGFAKALVGQTTLVYTKRGYDMSTTKLYSVNLP